MSDIECRNCGLEALTPEGGSPVTVEQNDHCPEFEYGAIRSVEKYPRFAATYCSLKCAAESLTDERLNREARP